MPKQPEFLNKPMHEMSTKEWESLCDGCGLCCLHRAEHPDTGKEVRTNLACRCLNLNSLQCNNYSTRQQDVPHCITLTPENMHEITWLPASCAYRLVANGKPLPDWHYLICGDKEAVHRNGISKRNHLLPDSELIEWINKGRKSEDIPAVQFHPLTD